ncbi:MAG TPA: hypothetical protein VHU18_12120 [Rhizomicrobium sp.]|jgi:uncharacterized membrane protein|nr:hypothetical protein [Rhizomicrobium sp.]
MRASPPSIFGRCTTVFAALALCAAALPANATPYTVIDVPGASNTSATGINTQGVVVGWYGDRDHPHGYIRAIDGSFTMFDPDGSVYTAPVGINDKGVVVGSYEMGDLWRGFIRKPNGHITTILSGVNNLNANAINAGGDVCGDVYDSHGTLHAFLRVADGTFIQFDPPDSIFAEADSINDSGVVAGQFEDSQYREHGFMRAPDGTITVFDVPGPLWTVGDTINAAGSIAGAYSDGLDWHGFIRDPAGGFTSFDAGVLPGTRVNSAMINDRGVIAGFDQTRRRRDHTYIRKPDGTINDLHVPGQYGYAIAFAINSKGAIAGTFQDSQNVYHGFLRTP